MTYVLEDSIGYWVRCVTRSIRARFNHNLMQAGIEVTSDQWAVLVTLYHKGGQSQKYLGYITMMDKTAITRLIDALEQQEILMRQQNPEDRRENLIFLTNKGKGLYRKMVPIAEKTLEEAAIGIPETQMAACKDTLQKIFRNLS